MFLSHFKRRENLKCSNKLRERYFRNFENINICGRYSYANYGKGYWSKVMHKYCGSQTSHEVYISSCFVKLFIISERQDIVSLCMFLVYADKK